MPLIASNSGQSRNQEIAEHIQHHLRRPNHTDTNSLSLALYQAKHQGLNSLDLSDQMTIKHFATKGRKDRASVRICRVLAQEFLSNNPHLTHLSFRNCYLGRQARILILNAIEKGAPHLQELDIKTQSFPRRVGLDNAEFNALSSMLGESQNLKVLKLEVQPLPIREKLVTLLKKTDTVRELHLGDSQVSFTETAPETEKLGQPYLDLESNHMELSALFDTDDLEQDSIISQSQRSSNSSLSTLTSPHLRSKEELDQEAVLDPLNFLGECPTPTQPSAKLPLSRREDSLLDPESEIALDALTCFDELQNMRESTNRPPYIP